MPCLGAPLLQKQLEPLTSLLNNAPKKKGSRLAMNLVFNTYFYLSSISSLVLLYSLSTSSSLFTIMSVSTLSAFEVFHFRVDHDSSLCTARR